MGFSLGGFGGVVRFGRGCWWWLGREVFGFAGFVLSSFALSDLGSCSIFCSCLLVARLWSGSLACGAVWSRDGLKIDGGGRLTVKVEAYLKRWCASLWSREI
ncbi:unnamed protein product [Arabis nemorensis]|uniref:Uncharacterized protein n=1 Tax=Arabis nemorensis TaxID=586526 RepID=A0A565C312_9BRAS|nr:unnamed protein product [Arabis nemorensis]